MRMTLNVSQAELGSISREEMVKRIEKARGGLQSSKPKVDMNAWNNKEVFNFEYKAPTNSKTMFSQVFANSANVTTAASWLKGENLPDLDMASLIKAPDHYAEEHRRFIPTLEPYAWDWKATYNIVCAHLNGSRTLTYGDPSSGKTSMHRNLAAIYGQPYYQLNGRRDLESDVILGRVDIHDGSLTFVLGEFTKAFQNGYYILIDEPFKIPSGILQSLQRPFERGGILQIDDMKGNLEGKQFTPGDGVLLNLADNVLGIGDNMDRFNATMLQDSSFLSRIEVVVKKNYLGALDEVALYRHKYEGLTERFITKAVTFARLAREALQQGNLSLVVDVRCLQAWFEMTLVMRDHKAAFRATVLSRFPDPEEEEAVQNMYHTTFGNGQ